MSAIRVSGAIFSGAFFGVLARWLIVSLLPDDILWPIFSINIAGSFLLGWFNGRMNRSPRWWNSSAHARLFFTTGMLGGFTTYSTFALDVLGLATDQLLWGIGFAAAQLILGVGAAVAGLIVGEKGGRR
ncbi:CrcB family protein [Arcanobacterium phocisimile]|uniref:Fluoride-specific ion channel FluC n=1 Tax=Arcanobacterium phocisimile TaxID=1302235 RepID=A0ABX7IFK4_9ACTO|nr:CrcB family protein [Arcanobacterium phocisimile]QRV01530.1 CrcB family protein [Arcanobacterium phocisimile]